MEMLCSTCTSCTDGLYCMYRWFVLHVQMVCIARTDGLYCTYRWFVLHVQMVCIARTDGLYCTYRWFVLHVQVFDMKLLFLLTSIYPDARYVNPPVRDVIKCSCSIGDHVTNM